MDNSSSKREQQLLAKISREYVQRGYEVKTRPSDTDLPDFLIGLAPDLLAKRKDETVVVEVKSRADLADKRLINLANALAGREGWRFELAVAQSTDTARFAAERALGPVELQARMDESIQLLNQGHPEAALLLLWSAVEGMMRLRAHNAGIQLTSNTSAYLLKKLFSEGLLDRAEYDALMAAFRVRNEIVHGYRPAQFDYTIVRKLADIVARPG